LHPRKGQEDLIRAVAEPVLRNTNLRIFLLGQPERADYEEHLRARAGTLGVAKRVVFAGYREDTPALLAGFDISALPARREAFGRVVIESMHAGTPVVVYDEGGLPELVRHERDGLVVRTSDIPGLADALARLASDPGLRARLAVAARERARAFTHQQWMSEILSLYRELLSIQLVRQSV
jgi:glycosyltransferase involved in cell wall biosynthesis